MSEPTYDGKKLARMYLTNVADRGVTPGYRAGGSAALAYLNALEVVARAADAMLNIRTPGGGGAWVQPGAGVLTRALSRLSRASSPRGATKGTKR
jgi:hypothetical protein